MSNGKKYRLIITDVTAQQFDSTVDPSQFPIGIIESLLSVTGYSYGDLTVYMKKVGGQDVPNCDGQVINHGDWLVDYGNGIVEIMGDTEFRSLYEEK